MSGDKVPAKRKAGRPPGSKNKATIAREEAWDKAIEKASEQISGHLTDIVEAMCEKAKKGDVSAAKLILERSIASKKASESPQATTPNFQIIIKASEVEINGQSTQVDQGSGDADHAPDAGADGPERSGSTGSDVIPLLRSAEGEREK